ENALDPAPLGQRVERQQAAAGGAVVTGAEGERGLDLDADFVGLDADAVVRAMHDETAGPHWRQTREALLDPVGRCDRVEGEGGCRPFPRQAGDLRAQSAFVRL